MNSNQVSKNLVVERKYLFFSACCALITVFTTIAIHYIHIPSGSFEENAQLYKSGTYLSLKWIILFHCLMVLFSMLGMALVIAKYAKALAILAFLFFSLFVFSEWERTLNELWYINGIRKQYLMSVDDNMKQFLRFEMQHKLFESNVHFLLFIIGITLGNACNGLALVGIKKVDRYLGIGLLLWSLCTACAFIYDFVQAKWMEVIINSCNRYYQPFIRLFIACWLWLKAKQLIKHYQE